MAITAKSKFLLKKINLVQHKKTKKTNNQYTDTLQENSNTVIWNPNPSNIKEQIFLQN